MYRLAILFSVLPHLICGYIRTSEDISGFEDNWLSWGEWASPNNGGKMGVRKDPLWVLKLGGADLGDLRLRKGSEKEEDEFDDAFGTIIATLNLRKRLSKTVALEEKKEPVTRDEKLDKQLQSDIMRIVNKFVMSTSKEPDAYLNDSDIEDDPTLNLFFKGPYSSLTVQYQNKVWHYFMPTSPLPGWFYEKHADVNELAVPSDVKTDFYKALVHMLQIFLSFPV